MHANSRGRRSLVASLAALGLVLTACGADDGSEEDGAEATTGDEATDDIAVVATTSILGDIAGELVGDDGTVEVIIPPGVDPHGFEPSAREAAQLRDADLVIANGLQLEESLLSALEAAEEDGVEVFELAGHLDPIAFDWDGPHDHGHEDDDHAHDDDEHGHEDDDHAHDDDDHGHEDDDHAHDDDEHGHEDDDHAHEDDGHGHEDDDHAHDDDEHGHEDDEHGHEDDDHGHEDDDHAHGAEDPHVWHDPVRMADGVELIAERLAEVSDVVSAEEWQERAHQYADELLEVHGEIEEVLAAVPDEHRQLVTNHDAFGYLAARYDFEVLGTVIPGSSTDAETNPQAFADLIETVEEAGVPAIFSENIEGDRLSEQLASEVIDRGDLEVEVVELYSDALGEPGGDGGTYLEMLRTNGQRIADALS